MALTILHTEWSSGWGGQEIRIVAESLAMRARGHSVVIACQPDSQILEKAKIAGITVAPIRIRKGIGLRPLREAVRIIRAHHVDVVHTHSSPDSWTFGLAARIAGVPVVRSRHLSAPVRGWVSRIAYARLADRVITSGAGIAEMIRANGVKPERVVSIPAGIDVAKFAPVADRRPYRQELNIKDDEFVVGIVAVLRSWKGHQDLIEAVHRLLAEGVPAKLLIVGAGTQERNIRNRIRELGMEDRVVLTGYRQDVPRLIAAMDCVALPSTASEATSQVLPQALAMKVPVIATDIGGLPEVVRDRETGLLVPPHDPAALSEALGWLYRHAAEARAMAERGYAHVHANFTFEGMIDRTEAVYFDLLLNQRGAVPA